jgi:hypothetical protein
MTDLRTKPDTGTALPLHTTFAGLTRTLQSLVQPAPTMLDVYRFVRSHPDGPGNFGWMMSAANVGDDEPVDLVKTRLNNCIPRWEQAAKNGHWSALQAPGRIRSAKTILSFIEQFEAVAPRAA